MKEVKLNQAQLPETPCPVWVALSTSSGALSPSFFTCKLGTIIHSSLGFCNVWEWQVQCPARRKCSTNGTEILLLFELHVAYSSVCVYANER